MTEGSCDCGRMADHKGACGFGREAPAVIRPEDAPRLFAGPSTDDLLRLHGLQAFNAALRTEPAHEVVTAVDHAAGTVTITTPLEVVTDPAAIAAAMADVEPEPAHVAVGFDPGNDDGATFMLVARDGEAGTLAVLADIAAERRRQVQLRDAGRFRHTIADAGMADVSRLAALTEELGEVARALQERLGSVTDKHGGDLRKELIQVAAIATGWCERLDADAEGGQ